MREYTREMVLNHASLVEAPRHEADAWLKDLATGIEEVVRSGQALAVLRMDREMYEIPCPVGRSLLDACLAPPHPPWPCKVTDEGDSVKNHPRRKQERMFRSVRGQRMLFTWHARFGDSRMHLRLYTRTREVEIGFIGAHRRL